jgi:L-lactate dehydrogenase (cytochrome)
MAKCMIYQHLRPIILAVLIVSLFINIEPVNAADILLPVIYKYAGKDGTKTYNEYHSANLIEKTLSSSDKKGDFDTSTITDTWLEAQKEETVSEADPNEKPPLSSIINLDDFEKAFAKSGSQKANAYVSGASNDLITLNANKTFWQRLWFRPRVMRNVSAVNTKMRMLGVDVDMPVWICPMGIAKQAGPEGEAALGRGAKSAGIVHCVSTTASMSVEEIVASGEGNSFFFQLYVDKQRHKTEAVLKQLEGLPQVKALFVTADLAVVSKREADERIKTQVSVSVYQNGQASAVDKKGGGVARSTGSFIDWSLSWDDLPWLRKHTKLPILVKGIQSAADAKTALDLGCDGIVVSNHGGRALDSAPATILTLLEIRRDCPEVFDKMEVLVDGGIRRGSDVLKAVLLGAKGIGVGRPFQCSVMYDTEGVEHCAYSKLYCYLDYGNLLTA